MSNEIKHISLPERTFGFARNVGRVASRPATLGSLAVATYFLIENDLGAVEAGLGSAAGIGTVIFLSVRKARMNLLREEEEKRKTTGLTKGAYTIYDIEPTRHGPGIEYNKRSEKKRALGLLFESQRLLEQYPIANQGPDYYDKTVYENPDPGLDHQPLGSPLVHFRFFQVGRETSADLSFLEEYDREGNHWREVKHIKWRIKKGIAQTSLSVDAYEEVECSQYPELNRRTRALSLEELEALQQRILGHLPSTNKH